MHHHCHPHAWRKMGAWRRGSRRHEDSDFMSHRSHGAPFGVRRPLRFLAFKLDLDDEQVKRLAQVLADLKTERAQAEVDDRRTVAALADALESAAFDRKRAEEGLGGRVDSANRLSAAVLAALEKTHEILSDEQREKLSYLLRSGVLTM